jgi:repressor LexA
MISTRTEEVLDFIIEFAKEMGYPPTVREIGAKLGMASPATVQAHITYLIEAGYIIRGEPSSPRTIRVLKHPRDDAHASTRAI